jgi:hypothetical protein
MEMQCKDRGGGRLGACEQDSRLREDLVGLVLSPRQKNAPRLRNGYSSPVPAQASF